MVRDWGWLLWWCIPSPVLYVLCSGFHGKVFCVFLFTKIKQGSLSSIYSPHVMILLFEQKCHLFFFVPEDPQWQPPKPTGLQRTGDPSKGQIWGFSSLYNLTIPFSGTQYCNIGWRLNHSLDSSSSPSATSRVISKASNYPWLNMWTCYHWYVTLIQRRIESYSFWFLVIFFNF